MITLLTTEFNGNDFEINTLSNTGVKSKNEFILDNIKEKHIGIFTFILPEDASNHSMIFDYLVNKSDIEFELDGELYQFCFYEQKTYRGTRTEKGILYSEECDVYQKTYPFLPDPEKLHEYSDSVFVVEGFGDGWSGAKVFDYLEKFYRIAQENRLQLIATTFRSAEVFRSPYVHAENIWFIERRNIFDGDFGDLDRKKIGEKDELYSLFEFKLDVFEKYRSTKSLSDLYTAYIIGRFGATWV